MSQRGHNQYGGAPRLHRRATKEIAQAVASVKTSSVAKATAVRVAKTTTKAKSSTIVGTAPPSHKSSTADANTYSVSFAAQATAPAALVATVTSTSTVQPDPTDPVNASASTSTTHTVFPQSAIIGIVVGTLGLAVVVMFGLWLCRRRRAKAAEGEWRRLNASQEGLGVGMAGAGGGKGVRVLGGTVIGAEEGEQKWGQAGEGEKGAGQAMGSAPTTTVPMLGYQMGTDGEGAPGIGGGGLDRNGTKAQFQFAAVSRDPAKMAAAREELLARGPGGKAAGPNGLTVNTKLARSMSTKSKIGSPMVISAPLPSPTPSESFVVRPPPSPFADGQLAKDVYPPPPAATIVPTTVEPADSWAEQASSFPFPRVQVRPETIISLGSTAAPDESYRHPSKDQLITNLDHPSLAKRRQSSAVPRRKQDTVFATIETYAGDPGANGWRPESTFARPQTMVGGGGARVSPERRARSSSVGRKSSTREVVDQFPVPPPMPTGLGLTANGAGSDAIDHPLAVPQPAASPSVSGLANTAPLRLARARSGKIPSPIQVPSLSTPGMQPTIASAPPSSAWAQAQAPLSSPGLYANRRQSMAAPILARQMSQGPVPEMPRPARSASIRQLTRSPTSPNPPTMPLPSPPMPVSPTTQVISYGSPVEQSALAALTHRSPKLASSPATDAASPSFDAGTPASTQDSAFSSAPATPRDFDPRFDGETDEERRQAEGGKGGVAEELGGRGGLFPPLEGNSVKLDGRTYNNDRTLSIYNMYDD